MDIEEAVGRLAAMTTDHPELRLLLVYGSRSRRSAHHGSDWDLGYLADDGLDELAVLADAAQQLGTDDVDLVNLARASALLRFEAARDGRLIAERDAGDHEAFVLDATQFWCDAGTVIRQAQDAVLADLPG